MIIKTAEFLCSSPRVEICPTLNKLEFAFIGRSNVGKSSLINMLTNRNGLAKVSGTPGKTQMINHFEINSQWYLVDLPGYGYAKGYRNNKRQRFSLLIEGYITQRKELHLVFVLIDSRHEPQKIDIEFMNFLGENGIPFMIIFTKADKLSKTKLEENVDNYKSTILESWEEMPRYFISSGEKGIGKEEILDCIQECINSEKERELTKKI